jgi:hypothetical protein
MENARRTTAIDHVNAIRRMSAILDINFGGWAEQQSMRRRGFNEFSESMKRGPQKIYLKTA